MSIFSFSKKRMAVACADSGSVSLGIIEHGKGGVPNILWYGKKKIPLFESVENSTIAGEATRLLSELISQAGREGFTSNERPMIFLGAPFIENHITHFSESFPEAVVVTKERIGLISGRQSSAFSVKDLKDQGSRQNIVGFFLNGYETHKPFGKIAKKIEIVQCTHTLNSRSVSDALSSFHSGAPESESLIVSMWHTSLSILSLRDFAIFSVGGEYLEIGIVQGGVLVFCGKIETGIARLLRDVASKLSISPNLARSTLGNNTERTISSGEKEAIAQAKLLSTGVIVKSLSSIADWGLIPPVIQIFSDIEDRALISSILSEKAFADLSGNGPGFSVTFVDSKMFIPHISLSGPHNPDVKFLACALFATSEFDTV